eukprot:49576_1
MPRKTDITFEGIYNEYYFDTDTKQKGKDIEDTGNDDTEEAEEDNKENEEDKPMFYPSYCYAKSHKPYALCVADTIKPKIIKKTKKKPPKSPKKKEDRKEDGGMDGIWDQYVKQFGYEPRSSNAFYKYAGDKGSKGVTYKSAANYYNKRKPKKKQILPKVVCVAPKPEEEVYHFTDMFEDDPDDITFNVPDEKMKEREIFMTVGLNSNIKQTDFERKKLNLVVLLDISGSMNKPFQNQKDNDNSWGYQTKMQIASKAVLGLLTNLNHEDRIGLVTFNRSAQVLTNVVSIGKIRVSFLRGITNIYANGGTNFTEGYLKCIELLGNMRFDKDDAYDNRIMILTDLRPNMGQKDPQKLMEMVSKHA